MRPFSLMIFLLVALTAKAIAADAATKCDELAGYQWEAGHADRGVEWDMVDTSPAIVACRAALMESPNAAEIQFRLGRTLLQDKQYDEAISLLRQSAEAGYSAAQAAYGTAFTRGTGVPLDYATANEWLFKAAEQDNPVAINNLAVAYTYGQGVSADPVKAFELNVRAAQLGYPMAMYNLATSYEYGNGTTPDFAKALEWNRKAVAAGQIMGYRGIGRAYDRGQGVEVNSKLAYEAWLAGAQGGDPIAQLQLALRYLRGRDVAEDHGQAELWMRKAASQGFARAQFYLGQLLLSRGTEQADYDEGIRWMNEAGARGELDAYLALANRYMGFGDLGLAREYAEVVLKFGDGSQRASAQQTLDMLQELELEAETPSRQGQPSRARADKQHRLEDADCAARRSDRC